MHSMVRISMVCMKSKHNKQKDKTKNRKHETKLLRWVASHQAFYLTSMQDGGHYLWLDKFYRIHNARGVFQVKFESMPIEFKLIPIPQVLNFNCTTRRHLRHLEWTRPFWSEFSWHKYGVITRHMSLTGLVDGCLGFLFLRRRSEDRAGRERERERMGIFFFRFLKFLIL